MNFNEPQAAFCMRHRDQFSFLSTGQLVDGMHRPALFSKQVSNIITFYTQTHTMSVYAVGGSGAPTQRSLRVCYASHLTSVESLTVDRVACSCRKLPLRPLTPLPLVLTLTCGRCPLATGQLPPPCKPPKKLCSAATRCTAPHSCAQ
eukprot:352249-Chlamydomonas_euryale.AAC.22